MCSLVIPVFDKLKLFNTTSKTAMKAVRLLIIINLNIFKKTKKLYNYPKDWELLQEQLMEFNSVISLLKTKHRIELIYF